MPSLAELTIIAASPESASFTTHATRFPWESAGAFFGWCSGGYLEISAPGVMRSLFRGKLLTPLEVFAPGEQVSSCHEAQLRRRRDSHKTEDGAALSSDAPTAQAQMSVVDVGLFGFTRGPSSPKVATVQMPSDYAGSFINSNDEYDSPGIGKALILLGIDPSEFPVGAKLLVTYQDGSKAVFVKVSSTGSYQWTWDGIHAWDANGHPIDRSGNQIANNNTSGSGTGG